MPLHTVCMNSISACIPVPVASTPLELPMVVGSVRAGFPSPAEDFMGEDLDLTKRCISNPAATFFAEVEGESMIAFGIYPGDTLVLDRSISAKDDDIALLLWDGGLTVKKLRMRRNAVELVSGDSQHPPILVTGESELQVWGVVTWSFRKHLRR